MADPTVSVILPTYRRAHLIGRALRSVLAQSYRDLEVLVLDDAPGDATEAVVRSLGDPRVRYVSAPARRGVAAARNQGISLARGSLIAFQDSDDEWLADKLAQQVSRLQSLPGDFAVTQGAVLRCEGSSARYLFSGLPPGDLRSAVLPCNNTTFLQAWLARRPAILEAGGFDERLPLWEDWELLIRIAQKFRVDMDQRPMAIVYDTPDSLIKQRQWRVQSLEVIVGRHRALMQEHPAALAVNLYALARFQLLDGNAGAARGMLYRSLRLAPLRARTWALLALSLMGTPLVRAVIRWRDTRHDAARGDRR